MQRVEFMETAFKLHCQADSSLSAPVLFALQYVNIFLCKYDLIHSPTLIAIGIYYWDPCIKNFYLSLSFPLSPLIKWKSRIKFIQLMVTVAHIQYKGRPAICSVFCFMTLLFWEMLGLYIRPNPIDFGLLSKPAQYEKCFLITFIMIWWNVKVSQLFSNMLSFCLCKKFFWPKYDNVLCLIQSFIVLHLYSHGNCIWGWMRK